MKTTLTILSFCIFLLSNIVLSQKDIIADQKGFGLTFLEAKKSSKCAICHLKGEEKIQMDDVEQKIQDLSAINTVEKLTKLISMDYAENVKARIAMTIARVKFQEIISEDSMIYSINRHYDYDWDQNSHGLNQNEIYGALDVLSWLDKSINYAGDQASKSFLRKLRMDYIVQEGFFYDMKNDYDYSLKRMSSRFDESSDERKILDLLNTDYNKTGYVPFTAYAGINTGLIYSYGKDSWIGGEIGLDLVDHRNPFYNRERGSIFTVSFQHNLNTRSNDISFDALEVTINNDIINLNLTQFGFHQGLPGVEGVKWFYRPEIGLAYGPFYLGYAYNLTFRKDARSLTEKNMLVVKFSYPLIRISTYQ